MTPSHRGNEKRIQGLQPRASSLSTPLTRLTIAERGTARLHSRTGGPSFGPPWRSELSGSPSFQPTTSLRLRVSHEDRARPALTHDRFTGGGEFVEDEPLAARQARQAPSISRSLVADVSLAVLRLSGFTAGFSKRRSRPIKTSVTAGAHETVCEQVPRGLAGGRTGVALGGGGSSIHERGICRPCGRLLTWWPRSSSSSLRPRVRRTPTSISLLRKQACFRPGSGRFGCLVGHSCPPVGGLWGRLGARGVVTGRGAAPVGCREIVESGVGVVVEVPLGVRGVACGVFGAGVTAGHALGPGRWSR